MFILGKLTNLVCSVLFTVSFFIRYFRLNTTVNIPSVLNSGSGNLAIFITYISLVYHICSDKHL